MKLTFAFSAAPFSHRVIAVMAMAFLSTNWPSTAQIVAPADPELSVPFSTGSEWKSFGVPTILNGGGIVFAAATESPTGTTRGIYRVSSSGELREKAATNQPAELAGPGVLFSSFKEPLFNERGDIAFIAKLSGSGVTSANNQGLFVYSTDSDSDTLVARKGMQAPGAPAGAQWKSFTSVAFARESTGGGAWMLAISATLENDPLGTAGPGGVARFNDTGLWLAENLRTELALREGQVLTVGGVEKTVKSFNALRPLTGTAGQGHGAAVTGVPARLVFTDNTQALVRVDLLDGPIGGVVIDTLAVPGDVIPGVADAPMKTFGFPTQNNSGESTVWISGLDSRLNSRAIVRSDNAGQLGLVTRKGDALSTAPGSPIFLTFTSVAVNNAGQFAVLAKLAGSGITTANDVALTRRIGISGWEIIASEGAHPPGTPTGAEWATFPSYAIGDANPAIAFIGKLRVPRAGQPNPGNVTSANDTGLWVALPGEGAQLLLREGDALGTKTVRSFVALNAISGSPTQRRTFSPDGRLLIIRVIATDGSQHLLRVQLPGVLPVN